MVKVMIIAVIASLIATPVAAKKKKPVKYDYWFIVCKEGQPDNCVILTTTPVKED